jgi:hypothetical protein
MPFWMEAKSSADDLLGRQHFGMRQRALDVGLPHALVKEHAGGVALDQVAHGFGEQGRPGFGLGIELVVRRSRCRHVRATIP